MAEIKLVIFDCDGVLMDSEAVAGKVLHNIFSQFGLKIDLEEFNARFAGSANADIIKAIENELELPLSANILDEIDAALDDECGNHAPMINGADRVLDNFDQARCICSNSPQTRLKLMLSRVGLYDRFRPYIFSCEDFDPPANKPRPDIFLKALSEFDVKAGNGLVVEDSMHGVEAAIAAGLRVIGFTGASHTYAGHADALMSAGADTTIRNLADLPLIIESFESWEGMTG